MRTTKFFQYEFSKVNESHFGRSMPLAFKQVREIALSLEGAVELDHHGRPSFRINEKIFATIWDKRHVNVMLDPVRIMEVSRKNPKELHGILVGETIKMCLGGCSVCKRETSSAAPRTSLSA